MKRKKRGWKNCRYLDTCRKPDTDEAGGLEEPTVIYERNYCRIDRGKGISGGTCVEDDQCPYLKF